MKKLLFTTIVFTLKKTKTKQTILLHIVMHFSSVPYKEFFTEKLDNYLKETS